MRLSVISIARHGAPYFEITVQVAVAIRIAKEYIMAADIFVQDDVFREFSAFPVQVFP